MKRYIQCMVASICMLIALSSVVYYYSYKRNYSNNLDGNNKETFHTEENKRKSNDFYGNKNVRTISNLDASKPLQKSDKGKNDNKNNGYYLIAKNGIILVYKTDKKTIVEHTQIRIEDLCEEEQKCLENGIYIESTSKLYSVLEGYSS